MAISSADREIIRAGHFPLHGSRDVWFIEDMQAIQLLAHGTPGTFALKEVPAPQPGPGEVIVNVHACGLNRLDLWLEQGGLPIPTPLPCIPGCEAAGTVAALGEQVTGWQIGEAVAIQSNLYCGRCEFCQQGEESFCLQSRMLGVQQDGGLAEQVRVPARQLVRLPAGVDFITSAALTLAGSTAMHMLTHRASVRPGDWVLVMGGASGVGSAAIQIARELGGRVVSTGSTLPKRNLALQLGAEAVVDSTNTHWPAEVRRITGRRGADLVVEHVGGEVLPRVFECLARGGTVVTCGATAGQDIHLNLWPFFVKQQRLIGSYSRNSADLKATLDWAASGKLRPVVDQIFPLAQTPEAYRQLRERKVLGKVVVTPREHP